MNENEYVFGANILENLTTGMYQDSKVIYREYIQNACDQIDKAVELGIMKSANEGKIEIWISENDRKISIEDNATGIPKEKFEKILANIADSSKRIGKDKGFRGIGRLCGLAYCRELIFSSTAPGEDCICIMRCDAQKMRELLIRNVRGEKFTAGEVLKEIYHFEYKTEKNITEEHWFKVELIDINEENTELLDTRAVKKYLSFTAPVQYKNTFSYQSEIYKHAAEIGYKIDEYSIKLNGEEIFKNYGTHFKTSKGDDDIFGIEFKDFYDDDGNLIMWLWFGLSQFKGIISKESVMRGMRLRKGNIQIGNEDTLQKLFNEEKGQHYFIGELFAISPELIPNSQRDYFNENETRSWFEGKITKYFKETLYKTYRKASETNSAVRKIEEYNKKVEEHQEKIEQNNYIDANHIAHAEENIHIAEQKAKEAQEKIDKLKKYASNSQESTVLTSVIERIVNGREKTVTSPEKNVSAKKGSKNKSQTPKRTDKLSRCSKQERKLLGKVFNIIMNSTDEETAEMIIRNIEEEFK